VQAARRSEALVTIGIPPTRPETGYGYIETAGGGARIAEVASFREKPDARTAARFVREGRFLWNSGMFFWRISTFMDQLGQASPEILGAAERFIDAYVQDRPDAARRAFADLPDISIDYALMERADSVLVVPATFDWDDLGAWDSLSRVTQPDGDGNVLVGAVVVSDCARCVIYNELTHPIAAMGLQDMVVAAGREGILVTPIERAQSVRELSRNAREEVPSTRAQAGS
jgi:mannose-1-phosphate guanylyltransferase